MDIIEMLDRLQVPIKWVSRNNGGQYAGPCPYCDNGDDRFCVWPLDCPEKGGRFWCRVCGKNGDAIQLLRDFHNLGFQEACGLVGYKVNGRSFKKTSVKRKPLLEEVSEKPPCSQWIRRAEEWVLFCHENLLKDRNSSAMKDIERRGIRMETVCQFKLGWNPGDKYPLASDWGIPDEEGAGTRKIVLAKGLVIPSFWGDSIQRVRVRLTDWKEGGKFGKYSIVPGSRTSPCLVGEQLKKLVVIESELDGLIVFQEAHGISAICLGSSTIQPTPEIASIIRQADQVVFIPDVDRAGAKAFFKWKSYFNNITHAVVPNGGSIGDFHEQGGGVSDWLACVFDEVGA